MLTDAQILKFAPFQAEDYRAFISEGTAEWLKHGMVIQAFGQLVGVLGAHPEDPIVDELADLYRQIQSFRFPDNEIRGPRFRSGVILALREYETKEPWRDFIHVSLLLQLAREVCGVEINRLLVSLATSRGFVSAGEPLEGEALISLMLDILANQPNTATGDLDQANLSIEQTIYALARPAHPHFREFHAAISLVLLTRASPAAIAEHLKLLDPWLSRRTNPLRNLPLLLLNEMRGRLRTSLTADLSDQYSWTSPLSSVVVGLPARSRPKIEERRLSLLRANIITISRGEVFVSAWQAAVTMPAVSMQEKDLTFDDILTALS